MISLVARISLNTLHKLCRFRDGTSNRNTALLDVSEGVRVGLGWFRVEGLVDDLAVRARSLKHPILTFETSPPEQQLGAGVASPTAGAPDARVSPGTHGIAAH